MFRYPKIKTHSKTPCSFGPLEHKGSINIYIYMYQSVTKLLVLSLKKNGAFLCSCPLKIKVAAADSIAFHFWPVLEHKGVFFGWLDWVGQLPMGQHPAVPIQKLFFLIKSLVVSSTV